jgi:PhoH-like ATPase
VTVRRSPSAASSSTSAEPAPAPTKAARRTRKKTAEAPVSVRRTFVLDTSVLLSDPGAFLRFGEHDVVLPLVVISELEGKRHHPELGYFARRSLRFLDELRAKHGRLDEPLPLTDAGGTLRVELNHADQHVLPTGFRADTDDARILAVALALQAEGKDVLLVTKDMPLRVKAGSVGLSADEYQPGPTADHSWTGMVELGISEAEVKRLYAGEAVDLDGAGDLPVHTGLVLTSQNGSALGRVGVDKSVRLVRGDREAFGVRGRSAEQRIALDLLTDDSVGIVSLGGRAGTRR